LKWSTENNKVIEIDEKSGFAVAKSLGDTSVRYDN